MKNLFKSIASVAIVAMAFAGCSKEATDVTAPITKKGVTVRFNAEVIDETRATLTPNDGETAFAAAWEDKDQIGIHAYVLDSLANEYADENIIGEWKNGAFEATFVNCPKLGESWEYGAYYPHVASCDASQNVTVPFGAMRTQSDNSYNSQYDIMVSDKVSVDDGANAGKDKDGNDIVFPMHRLSAIAYFHFTTDKAELQNEKVVSVTLTVDDGKVIAADSVKFCYTTNTPKIETVGNGTNSIELTYDEANRPTANDFTAWFNLLPVEGVTSVAIEIETENYVATIERKTTASALNYEAGKLYKVAGKISEDKWKSISGDYAGTYLILAKVTNGNYWYMSSEITTTSKKRFVAVDSNVSTISESTKFDDATDEYAWVVEKSENNEYTIQSYSEGKYISFVSGGTVALVDDIDNAELFVIENNDDGTVSVQSKTDADRFLARNSGSSNNYFAFYQNNQLNDLTFVPYSAKERLAQPVVTATATNEGTIELSWEAVAKAANYSVTFNGETQTTEETSKTFTVEKAGNYTISVVANPSDTETYRASKAGEATATILANPTNIKRTTMNAGQLVFTWNKATNATSTTEYAWAICEGENEIATGTVAATTATYNAPDDSLLKANTEYTLKVKTKASDSYGALKEPATGTCSYSPKITVSGTTTINYTTPSEKTGTITVTLTDLVADKVTVESDDFITAKLEGTKLSYTIAKNEGEARSGKITLSAADADTVTINVTQATCFIGNPTIAAGASLTTAKIKATWNTVANADSYDWYLTAADGTKIDGASGRIEKPTSGTTVSLSTDVSACGLTKDTKYVLYVKSVAATDYKVQDADAKVELTCAEAAAVTEYTDVLTAEMFKATSTKYENFSGVSYSGGSTAVYAGNSAQNSAGAIQLRSSSSNSGIVTTTSGGKVKEITIKFASGNKTLDIYGNSKAYTQASELYDTTGNTNQGTKIGSLSKDGTINIKELGDYEYIGLRSNSGAIYITSITIVWEK